MILEDLNKPDKKVYPCKVRTIKESLSDKDAKTFIEAVNDESWQAYVLARELGKRGIEISDRTIRSHRYKLCSCSKI